MRRSPSASISRSESRARSLLTAHDEYGVRLVKIFLVEPIFYDGEPTAVSERREAAECLSGILFGRDGGFRSA